MATVSVRYIVNDVDEAISFYCQHLGFEEVMHPAPTFAMLSRGDLRLVLSAPGGGGGGGQAMPDGTLPTPGGWNRFSIEVPDLDAVVTTLREHGVCFRNDIVDGVGGRQILVEDPSGNPVELFQPTRPEASLSGSPPTEELLAVEREGWNALCQQRGAELFGDLMTHDALMVLANGQVMDRDEVVEALAEAPPWVSFELEEARVVAVGEGGAALVYRARAVRHADSPPFVAAMTSVYARHAGRWRLVLYTQTPVLDG